MGGTSGNAHAHRSAPAWFLLIALAIVPTIGMGVFTVGEATTSADAARAAVQTAEATTHLAHILDVLFVLTKEKGRRTCWRSRARCPTASRWTRPRTLQPVIGSWAD